MTLEEQLQDLFGFNSVVCENLNTPTNDVISVTTPTERFALKLYNSASRTVADVQWELELIAHLIRNGVPVVEPMPGRHGYVETFLVGGRERTTALFRWATGEKPVPGHDTYFLLGKAAAQIHRAADTFTSALARESYDADVLIDEQLGRMKTYLVAAGRWQQVVDLGERLKQALGTFALDRGICHMDLTLDNVHRDGDTMTVFDFDSAGECWRSIEPSSVLRLSGEYFQAWLKGYRSVRSFSRDDEEAVTVFTIVNDLRGAAWKLGVARSSRGTPTLRASDLPGVVDEWLDWESNAVKSA